MQTTGSKQWRGWLLSVWVGALALSALAQDPPYRPRLMWHIAASNLQVPSSFTEDGEYLLTEGHQSNTGLLMVYRMSDLLNPNMPKGQALVSYDYESAAYTSFTDRDETGQEYVVGGSGNVVRMWRFVRDPLAFRGGYLEAPKQWTISGWTHATAHDVSNFTLPTMLVLRGDRTDRRYNRLAVSGDSNGNLRIVLLDYNATSQSPVVVSGAHRFSVTAVTYDAATRRLITGGRDGLIRIWQVALDANGVPSLTPLQTIAAHWSDVMGLALATVGSNRYLVSMSDDGTISGWSWPTPGTTPIWQKPFETTFGNDVSSISRPVQVMSLTPYGDLPWVLVHGAVSIGALTNTFLTLLLDPVTGDIHYRYLSYGWVSGNAGFYQYASPLLASPPIGGNRYIAGMAFPPGINYSGEYRGAGGVWLAQLGKGQSVASAPASCTALDTLSNGSTRYLAAGYANGELRLYRNTGSGWTLWDSSSTLHPSKQIVGVKLLTQGGAIYTLSADIEGQLVIAQHTGSVTLKLSQASGLTAAEALALGQDSTSALAAVCGHQDGAPRVEVFRLTWSGSTPSLSSLAGFTVSGETGPVVDVEFVQAGSADVVVSTGARVISRWNFSGSAYSRVYSAGDASGDPTYTALSVAGGRIWRIGSPWFSPSVSDVANGARLWNASSWFGNDAAGPVLGLDSEHAVWGVAHRAASQDGSYWLMRGRALPGGVTQAQAYNMMQQGLQARLPSEAASIARDPSDPNWFYVGCLDGTIQQVYLPDLTPRPMAYAGLSGTLFEIVQNRIATFMTGWPDAFTTITGRGVGIRHAAIVRLTDGQVISRAMQCNADGSTGCAPADVGINALMRLSPSGNILYGYEVNNNRLTGWNGTTMAPLFNTTSFPTHWWPIGLDDTRVALLYNEARGSYQIGNTTYYRYRPVIRVIKWTPSLVTEATRPLDENTEMGFIMTNAGLHPNYLQGMRWDMNATRRVAAVYGAHYYDPNTPNASRRRILLLHRPNANDWATWQLREVLEQDTDFPSGVYPTMIRFHPTAPNVLYVGLSNGRLRLYRIDANGNLLNRTNPDELVPTLGNLGAVSAMDVGNYVLDGLNYSAIVFGGPEGLSVWVGFVCQPGWLNEVHFYKTDIAFFPDAGMGYVQVEQPDPSQPPFMVYSNGLVMSAAKLEDLPQLPCPEDVNRDGIIDDSDVLEVLFAFGGEGYMPADVNCDGLVDDSDLLQVLFAFGQSC